MSDNKMSDVDEASAKKEKKKQKKEKRKSEGDADDDGAVDDNTPEAERGKNGIAIIAHPLAGKKLTRKCLKLVKKASKVKGIRRGVKEVVKALRKGEKGVMVIAGNITPIDVITHIPILCEENEIPYVYVPAKEELGIAGSTKRPTSCILVHPPKADAKHQDIFDSVKAELEKIAPF